MARRRRGWEAVPLVGPGSELQLTLDGRAVPHVEVAAAWALAQRSPRHGTWSSSPGGETRLPRLAAATRGKPPGAGADGRTRP